MDISIVIPCLNEEKTIKACIEKCFKAIAHLNISGEIIVVDNNSSDNSADIAKNLGAKVIKCASKGYGNALRCGFSEAQGEYILMGDGDNSYDFSQIPDLFNLIKKTNADMVTGSRLKGEIEKGAMPIPHRYIGTPALTFCLNLFYHTDVSDSQCGMRLMSKKSLQQITLKCGGMEFASELFVEYSLHKFVIKEIPIRYLKTNQKSKLNPLRDGLRHLFYLFLNLHRL